MAKKEGLRIYWRKINTNSISESEVRKKSGILCHQEAGITIDKAAVVNEGIQYNRFSKNMWLQLAKEAFNLIYLHILPSPSPLMTRQIKFPYSKIILMKCLESDHNTVKVINYNWQKKRKTFLECNLDPGTSEKSIYVSDIWPLKSGQTRGSFTATGMRVKHYNLRWPILKENKNKSNVNTLV